MRRFASSVIAASALAAFFPARIALAQQQTYPVRVIAVKNSPIEIASCKAAQAGEFAVLVVNRAKHELLNFAVRYRAYDVDNTPIGEAEIPYSLEQPLSPGDSGMQGPWYTGMGLSEPQSALSYYTCRIEGATFTGKRSWRYGQRWAEPLLPAQSDEGPGAADESGAVPPPPSHLNFAVTNTWNDIGDGVLFVHAAVVIRGGEAGATVSPSDFSLTMQLSNGATKTYAGLTQAAPSYQKYSALTNQTTTAYTVDPSADLGRMGSVTVPAHGTATVTVTFAVTDSVADPAENRSISYR